MKWLPALIWMGTIAYFSLSPLKDFPHPAFPGSDKIYHLLSYAILQLLFYFPVKKAETANLYTKLFFLSVLFGLIMEIIQGTSVNGRTGELGDLLFNTLGALMVYFFFLGRWGKASK